jgi:hypothetical protein
MVEKVAVAESSTSNFWGMLLICIVLFSSCDRSPSYFETYLHAAYGYKVDGRIYNGKTVEEQQKLREVKE